MKQTERKRDKTPAEPPEGGSRWVCQIWTEEQKKEGASHSGLLEENLLPNFTKYERNRCGRMEGVKGSHGCLFKDSRSDK